MLKKPDFLPTMVHVKKGHEITIPDALAATLPLPPPKAKDVRVNTGPAPEVDSGKPKKADDNRNLKRLFTLLVVLIVIWIWKHP